MGDTSSSSSISRAIVVTVRILCFMYVFGVLCLNAPGQNTPAPAALTAEELIAAGFSSFNASQWAAAESALTRFLADYGANPQAAAAVAKVKPLLGLTQVRLKKFAEALPWIEQSLKEIPNLPSVQAEELRFWLGICQMQAQNYDAARAVFDKFVADYPGSVRRNEAVLMSGTVLVVQERFPEAADYFQRVFQVLQGLDRGRAVLMGLYCLLQSDRLDDALALLTGPYARTTDIIQLAGLQMLSLELGAKFLEKEEYRKAVAAFQRVWKRERVLKHQEFRLQYLKDRLAALETQRADPQWTFQLSQLVTKIDRELKSFREIKNYDSALQLRLAAAFQGMNRFREAALIMEAMLNEMPADPMVEQASINLLQCWTQIDRWPKVVEAADLFEKKFPESKQLPLALFLKGQAQQSDALYPESIATFQSIVKRFGQSELAPRAEFMSGFSELLQEKYPEALSCFDKVLASYPKSDMAETASYWRGMGLSLNKQHEASREAMADYLKKYKEGKFVSEAHFRRCYSAQAMKDYKTSIAELKTFLKDFPKSAEANEALVLLGDAYMAQGEVDLGIDTFKRITPDEPRFFEEGWFKIGKALRLMEKVPELRAHMLEFRNAHPESPRVAEALYWIGWTYRTEEQPDKAREVYWQAIEEFGNKAEMRSVEDLFLGAAKLYKSEEERAQLDRKLTELYSTAEANKANTLMVRTLWARAQLCRKTDPYTTQKLLTDAGKIADVSTTSPLLLADFADATRESGSWNDAEKLYRGMLKWNPRAPQKDRAFAGLGWIALSKGKEKDALQYFDRFDKETAGSPLQGKVQLQRSQLLLKSGEKQNAREVLDTLLANKFAAGKDKAEALCLVGELLMSEGKPGEAIAYFQRVYVMYGRWAEFVAKAYLRSGQAFEEIHDKESALNTYNELIGKAELANCPETGLAKERVSQLESSL